MKHENFMHQNLNGIKYFWKLFEMYCVLSMYLFGETRFKFKFSQQLKICFWIYVDELHILLLSIISSQ